MSGTESRHERNKRCETLECRYANYFEVGHNAYEFIVEFGQYQPRGQRVQMQTRIVTGPVFAKLLSRLLTQSIDQFEREHGVISDAGDQLDPLELVKQSIKGYERPLNIPSSQVNADKTRTRRS